MELFVISMLIIIIICFFLIWYISTYNRYQSLIIRINEAEVNIDTTLRKRFDLLNKSIGIIKGNSDIKDEVLEIIVKLRSRKLTNFDLDRQLYEAINEFHNILETNDELKGNENIIKINHSLAESETEIVASRKYYNDIITNYNKLLKKFPTNLVAIISKYKEKTYFDGKNLEDDIVNDFKL
ncbi:MAG: LemA family protein [Bacilli bacterium]|nr:LemA family protein [Bacilli bacterium]MDD4808932.1 LemA family protein [Bacilli bacterium]